MSPVALNCSAASFSSSVKDLTFFSALDMAVLALPSSLFWSLISDSVFSSWLSILESWVFAFTSLVFHSCISSEAGSTPLSVMDLMAASAVSTAFFCASIFCLRMFVFVAAYCSLSPVASNWASASFSSSVKDLTFFSAFPIAVLAFPRALFWSFSSVSVLSSWDSIFFREDFASFSFVFHCCICLEFGSTPFLVSAATASSAAFTAFFCSSIFSFRMRAWSAAYCCASPVASNSAAASFCSEFSTRTAAAASDMALLKACSPSSLKRVFISRVAMRSSP